MPPRNSRQDATCCPTPRAQPRPARPPPRPPTKHFSCRQRLCARARACTCTDKCNVENTAQSDTPAVRRAVGRNGNYAQRDAGRRAIALRDARRVM